MTWIDEILGRCPQQEMINDSKTPSGIAHVGSLRGVLIHDALLREARERGVDARFTYGCDDMDPVDEIPHGTGEYFREHLGKPLCRAPVPPGIAGDNMARAYFDEFTSTFGPLGVDAEFYFMSDVYRSGRLDETIDAYLRAASKVRAIYLREAGSARSEEWLPFQPICERCGRIGTTFASDYDGETVAYECRHELVDWAEGCGAKGRTSPFGGAGKLPWKLEWAAKWQILPVTLEGAGKDHMGAGGSHRVASALAREVLKCAVPCAFSYEFFTSGSAKMSSSKGIGLSASELAATLPPELLRYLVLRTQPRRALDFAVDLPGVNRAFAEYERLWRGVAEPKQRQLFAVSQATARGEVPPAPGYSPPFDSVVSVVQQPHLDLATHIATLGLGALADADLDWLDVKRAAAESWSQRFSETASRLTVTDDFMAGVHKLSNQQRAFLAVAARILDRIDKWAATPIQAALFDAARIVGIETSLAFEALYTAFFGWPEGPRAGTFLEFVGKQPTCSRLGEVKYSYRELLDATAVSRSDWEHAVSRASSSGQGVSFLTIWSGVPTDDPVSVEDLAAGVRATRPGAAGPTGDPVSVEDLAAESVDGLGSLELFAVDDKARTTAVRTVFERADGYPAGGPDPIASFHADALAYVAGLLDIAKTDVRLHSHNPFATVTDREAMA